MNASRHSQTFHLLPASAAAATPSVQGSSTPSPPAVRTHCPNCAQGPARSYVNRHIEVGNRHLCTNFIALPWVIQSQLMYIDIHTYVYKFSKALRYSSMGTIGSKPTGTCSTTVLTSTYMYTGTPGSPIPTPAPNHVIHMEPCASRRVTTLPGSQPYAQPQLGVGIRQNPPALPQYYHCYYQ